MSFSLGNILQLIIFLDKDLLKQRDFFLDGKHIKARARKRSRHRERESSNDDSNVVYEAVDQAKEDREFQVHILIVLLSVNFGIRSSYWRNKKKENETRRKDKRKYERKSSKGFVFAYKSFFLSSCSQKRAIPEAFLKADAPDVKKGKLDSKNTGELKNYERLVMERERRGLKIPNVLHEF